MDDITLPQTITTPKIWRPLPIRGGLEIPSRGMPVVYLIHFLVPYYHARHYLGFTWNLPRRLKEHMAGVKSHGSCLLAALNAARIPWYVVRIWTPGDHELERRLKAYHKSSQLCPVCKEAKEWNKGF